MRKIYILAFTILIAKIASAQTFSPQEAVSHINDSIKVCGKIFGGRFFETSNNAPTLLNMGGAFPNSPLTIMIPGVVRSKMGYAPEIELKEKNICVTGKVILFKEKPEIIVYNMAQLEIAK
jgi:hypothetical protein